MEYLIFGLKLLACIFPMTILIWGMVRAWCKLAKTDFIKSIPTGLKCCLGISLMLAAEFPLIFLLKDTFSRFHE